MKYPKRLEQIVDVFRKLPGIGLKSAQRFAFHLVDCMDEEMEKALLQLQEAKSQLGYCKECNGLIEKEVGCQLCADPHRHDTQLCIVAYAREVFAFEQTKEYQGRYYVLGALLSPLNGFLDEHLPIKALKETLKKRQVKEVIIALDATVEGEATALYLKQQLQDEELFISRVAFGLPLGSSLEFADGGTLAKALEGRSSF